MSQDDGQIDFQPPETPVLEKMLPAYSFESLIAKGGMGAVYKAKQKSLDRDVAVKILPREFGEDPAFRKSFETEARAMAKLNHTNLIAVYDSGDIDGMPYIVMEYVPGKSLYHSAFNKKIEPSEAVRLMRGVLAGLADAHEHGIIHRDIKPANILLTPKVEPKIGDFGLAVHADADGPGLVMGTPGYTAPEVISNPEAADRRSDLYAVGVILYELLAGERPPVDAPPPSGVSPVALDKVIQRACHPNPAFRYPDAAAMSAALKAADDAPAKEGAGSQLKKNSQPAAAPQLAKRKVATTPQLATPAATPPDSTPETNGDGEETDEPAEGPAEVEIQVGSNWGLIRNLLIIAGLIVAIAFTWKIYKKKKAAYAEEDRRIKSEQAQKKAEKEAEMAALRKEAARKAKERAKQEAELAKKRIDNPEPEPETAIESLARLKEALAAGERGEMPIGTTRRGNSDLFLYTEPLGWHQAAFLAEQHGGHLAVPTSNEDLTSLAESIGSGSIWIGAGRTDSRKWVTIDGAPWTMETKPAGRGAYAALSDLGLVRGTEPGTQLPFMIEWRRDGSNPATLDAMLQRVRQTLDDPDPSFPPGSARFETRHYLLVRRPTDWGSARQTAELSGGSLAVPSDLNEAIWIEGYLTGQKADGSTWLGGSRSSDTWTWTTGEEWSLDRWADSASAEDEGSVLMAGAEGRWVVAAPDEPAEAFLIEWSNDSEGSVAETTKITAGTGDVAALQTKCRELVAAAIKERDKELTANARSFQWDLDVYFRGLSRPEQATWGIHVQKLKGMVSGNRVPGTIDSSAGVALSERMARIATYASRKQKDVADACLYKLTRIQESYLQRLGQQMVEAERKGELQKTRTLKKMIQEAQIDADDLPDLFGIEN